MGETAVTREEVRKLIGGYATGTLTEAERELLFAAALEDQELFDELAGEQIFKELLETPGARARLLTATAPAGERRQQSWWAWGAVAAAAAVGLLLIVTTRTAPEPAVEIAAVKQEPAQVFRDEVKAAPEVTPETPAAPKRSVETAAGQGQQGQQTATAEIASDRLGRVAPPASVAAPAVPGERDQLADKAAPQGLVVRGEPADTAVLKAELREADAAQAPQPVAPVAIPAPAPPQAAARALEAQAGGGKGGAGGGRANVVGGIAGAADQPTAVASQVLAVGQGKAAAPFSFTYERTADSLRIVPGAPGFLLVTAGGPQPLFPQNQVLQGSNVIVPLPAGTGEITIVFAAAPGAPAAQAMRRDEAKGTVAEPNPSASSRLVIIVPAVP